MRLLNQIHAIFREHITKIVRRSSEWPSTRRRWLKTHPKCAACGGNTLMQVHHIQPFHDHPELELDLNNFISLCMGKHECHLKIGHAGSFSTFNAEVIQDSLEISKDLKQFDRIYARAKLNRKHI